MEKTMKSERILREYYQNRINEVNVPPVPVYSSKNQHSVTSGRFTALAFAAVIALLFIPLFRYADTPPVLAMKAADFSREYKVGKRITEGIINLQKIAGYSSISGGKK